jgi:putative phosphoserine phosphatase/1-acylglycerol-3-phosphate O-acyltransferase
MQAGVPMVPIVIHNATDVLPKGGFFIRPSVVHVDVLPPVSTDGWSAETIDKHVAEVRGQYLRRLGQTSEEKVQLASVK